MFAKNNKKIKKGRNGWISERKDLRFEVARQKATLHIKYGAQYRFRGGHIERKLSKEVLL